MRRITSTLMPGKGKSRREGLCYSTLNTNSLPIRCRTWNLLLLSLLASLLFCEGPVAFVRFRTHARPHGCEAAAVCSGDSLTFVFTRNLDWKPVVLVHGILAVNKLTQACFWKSFYPNSSLGSGVSKFQALFLK